MKKLFKLWVVVLLGISAVGCSSSDLSAEQANEAFNAMMETQSKFDSASMSGNLTATIDGGGIKMDFVVKMESAMQGMQTLEPVTQVKSTMNFFGQEIVQEIYYADGFTYTTSGAEKIKAEIPSAENALINANPLSAVDLSVFKNYTAKKSGGDFVFSISITSEEIMEVLAAYGQALPPVDGVEIKNALITVTSDANTNYLKTIDASFEVSAEIEGKKNSLVVAMNCIYSDYDATKVDQPLDLDAYIESYDEAEIVYDLTPITDNLSHYTEGLYEVGKDMEAGEYIVYSLSDFGAMLNVVDGKNQDKEIMNLFFVDSRIATLQKGQIVDAYNCILVAIDDVKNIDPSQPGMYKVGVHIPAGVYTLSADDYSSMYTIYANTETMETVKEPVFIANDTDIVLENGQYIQFQGGILTLKD